MRFFTFHSFLSLVVLVHIAQGTENSEEKPVQEPEVSTEAPSSNDETQATRGGSWGRVQGVRTPPPL